MKQLVAILYLGIALFLQVIAGHASWHFLSGDCVESHQTADNAVFANEVDCALCALYHHSQTLDYDAPQTFQFDCFAETTTASFLEISESPVLVQELIRTRGPPHIA